MSLGTNLTANSIPSGNKIISLIKPNIGIKSGIKSSGLKAYSTTNKITNLAYQGTLRLINKGLMCIDYYTHSQCI